MKFSPNPCGQHHGYITHTHTPQGPLLRAAAVAAVAAPAIAAVAAPAIAAVLSFLGASCHVWYTPARNDCEITL